MRAHIAHGYELPDWAEEKPELATGLELFFQAFWDLCTCRYDGLLPIPWHRILQYCETYDIRGYQRELMFEYIGEMDVVYLRHFSKKSAAS